MDIKTIPFIVSVDPRDRASDVPETTEITAVFSTEIDPATVGDSSFIVADWDFVPVTGTFSFPDGRTVVFTPSASLQNLAEYNVLVTTEVRDLEGISLFSEKIWYFTTISAGTVPDPVFTPPAGEHEGPQRIILECQDQSASIRYTTDGTEPSRTVGSFYTAPFQVNQSTSWPIKAIAYRAGFTDSSVSSVSYTLRAFTPVLEPPPGMYSFDPLLTLSTLTTGATIRYTLDLSDPVTSVTAMTYSEPFAVTGPGSVTIRALTISPDPLLMENSTEMSAVFVINYEEASPPVFSPPPGTYTSEPTATISSATPGSRIMYTTDGSDPFTNGIDGGTVVSLRITQTLTIKAYAYDEAGLIADSSVSTGTYIIAPLIYSMNPDKGPNYAPITVTITGIHFNPGVTAQLTRNVLPPIPATDLVLVSGSKITCTFDLTGQTKGKWSLVVTNPDSGTALKNEFRIY